jgi:hypothetical protein
MYSSAAWKEGNWRSGKVAARSKDETRQTFETGSGSGTVVSPISAMPVRVTSAGVHGHDFFALAR